MKTGFQLRKLFIVILTFCTPSDPKQLWLDFQHHLCDDLRHQMQHLAGAPQNPTDDQVYDYELYLIRQTVEEAGSTMERVQLDTCIHNWAQYHEENQLIQEQIQLQQNQPPGAAEAFEAQLNPQQQAAFNQIYHSAVEANGQIFFLDGPAGTGKTFLYKVLCYKLWGEGHYVLCVASSGIAALLLPGRHTSHSQFKIPINIHEASTCSIGKNSDLAQLLRRTKLIIWDEVPMQHKHCTEAFDRTCQDLFSKPDQLFGGLTVVFGGDFRQTLPVVPHGEPEDIIAACLKHSQLWPNMQNLQLTENM
ncbi:hypothetical protein FRC08_004455 [Ceratobasidium sp. 394]|nr:hypothetical protein FRC08_004455 [Ceratobasidium sp. 394]